MKKKIVWSSFNKAIFEDVAHNNSHTLVIARAGCGKSSTLLEALKFIPPKKSILLLAFNTRVAEYLKEHAPEYKELNICTCHSFGYSIVRQELGKKVRFDPNKSFRIIKESLVNDKKTHGDKLNYEAIFEISRAMSLCQNLIIDTPRKIDELLDEFGIATAGYSREDFINRVIWGLSASKKETSSISFDEMIYFPFVHQLNLPQYDRVLIDEWQDLTPIQNWLAINSCKKDGRILGFCDDKQLLYSFRGVNLDSVDQLQKKLNATVLSLPISYRCSKKIIFEAQKIVPDITFAPDASDGEVYRITEDQVASLIRPGDILISRTNVELVRFYFELLRNKIPASLKGKELGIGLNAIIKHSKKKTVSGFLEWLEIYKNEEVQRLKTNHRDINPLLDKVACLRIICDGKKNIEEVKESITQLFDDREKRSLVKLGTIHYFKGDEADRVFFLTYTMRFGNNKAEDNARYVAITRAKQELYLVESSP